MKKLFDAPLGTKNEGRRIGLLSAAILAVTTLVAGAGVFYVLAGQINSELEKGIVRTLNDREMMFSATLEHLVEDTRDAATLPHLLQLMKQAALDGVNDTLRLEMAGIFASEHLSGMALLDAQGQPVLSQGKFVAQPEVAVVLRAPAGVILFWQGGYYLNIDAPIREEGRLLGTLHMEMPLKELTAMVTDYRDLGKSGEVVVCAALDRESMQCFPSRHRPQGFRSPRMRDQRPLPMSIALDGQAGFVIASDYRRVEVFDAYKPIGHTGLGMVVKIDTEELAQPLWLYLLPGVGMLALLSTLGAALLRWRVSPLVREVLDSRLVLKNAHDKMLADHAALLKTHQALMQADAKVLETEAEIDRQMNALADANVRMVLYHASMDRVREADEALAKGGGLEVFCRDTVNNTMSLTGARYGAIGLFGADGNLASFVTEGIDAETRARLGKLPTGKGLLGAFYREGKIVRVDNIATDPRSGGFPPNHPPMKSLIGVPIGTGNTTHGVLYLADKLGGEPFTDNDEILMDMLGMELGHIFQRHDLLGDLRMTNQALQTERAEQQILIGKLEETRNQLLQSEKMASVGQLAAGVAHEINNPIGFVYSNLGSLDKYLADLFAVLEAYEQAQGDAAKLAEVEALKKKVDLRYLKEDLPALMSESRDGITRVKKIVQDLKDFSHADTSDEWQWADLHKGLDSTLNVARNEIKYKAEVQKEYGDLPDIECYPSQLNQVFMNLLVNAAHAIEERGVITIRTGKDGDQVWVEIADTGKGIPEAHIKSIFDPFFTTKPIGTGTGLGLSLSYGIVQKHHGHIDVSSEVGKGTTFRVWLPVQQERSEETEKK